MARFSQESQSDGTTVLSVAGEIDLAVTDDFVAVADACLAQASGIELDLGDVTFIDSSGLGVLVRVRKEADQQSKSFNLARVSPAVQRLLEVTGLDHVFQMDDAQDVRASVRRAPRDDERRAA